MKFSNLVTAICLVAVCSCELQWASAQTFLPESPRQDTSASHLLKGGVSESGHGPALESYSPWGFKSVRDGTSELPARITEVVPSSPAYRAGLAKNDKIIDVAKEEDGFTLRVERGGKLYFVKLAGQEDTAASRTLHGKTETAVSPRPEHQRILINIYETSMGGWGQSSTRVSVSPDGSVSVDGQARANLLGSGNVIVGQYLIDDGAHCNFSYSGCRGTPATARPFSKESGQLAGPAITGFANAFKKLFPQADTIIIEDTDISLGGCNDVDFAFLTPRYTQLESGTVVVINHSSIRIGGSNNSSFTQASGYAHSQIRCSDYLYSVGGSNNSRYSFDFDSGGLPHDGLNEKSGTDCLPPQFRVIEDHFREMENKYWS